MLLDDLRLGLLLVVNGGRPSWVRLCCSAIGIGLCATVLLLAAAMGPALDARDGRSGAMTPQFVSPWWTTDEVTANGSLAEPGSFAANEYEIPYRQQPVRTTDLSAAFNNLATAPPPPGVDRFPGPGELVVSPALRDLLNSPEGAELRPRVAGEIIGSIGPEGLLGPGELRFYRGTTAAGDVDNTSVATGWGMSPTQAADPMTVFTPALTVAGTAIIIVPLLIFVWLMSKLGATGSDRRFALLRLLGASGVRLRRIAAVEALLASLGGLAFGAGGFLMLRSAADVLKVGPAAFYPQDLTPHPVAILFVVVLVPVLAVGSGWIGARRVALEPLAVVRQVRATRARRLGPGLVLLALGAMTMVGSLYAGALSTDINATVLLALSISTLLTARGSAAAVGAAGVGQSSAGDRSRLAIGRPATATRSGHAVAGGGRHLCGAGRGDCDPAGAGGGVGGQHGARRRRRGPCVPGIRQESDNGGVHDRDRDDRRHRRCHGRLRRSSDRWIGRSAPETIVQRRNRHEWFGRGDGDHLCVHSRQRM